MTFSFGLGVLVGIVVGIAGMFGLIRYLETR